MDPITIFAACKAAHAGIRECIDLYQDFKKDLSEGASLKDAEGNDMTAEQITAFFGTLP